MVRIVPSMSDAAGDTPRSARRWRVPGVVIAGGLVAILGLVTAVAYVPIRWRQHDDGLLIRPTGIPASVPTRTADLMQLSPALTACIREFRAVKPGSPVDITDNHPVASPRLAQHHISTRSRGFGFFCCHEGNTVPRPRAMPAVTLTGADAIPKPDLA
jgi:hypothetical protein